MAAKRHTEKPVKKVKLAKAATAGVVQLVRAKRAATKAAKPVSSAYAFPPEFFNYFQLDGATSSDSRNSYGHSKLFSDTLD